MTSLREKILSRRPVLTPHPIPEWGVTVHLAELSARDRMELAEPSLTDQARLVLLVTRSVCDAGGVGVFGPEDGERILGFEFDTMQRLITTIRRLNRIGDDEVSDEKKGS